MFELAAFSLLISLCVKSVGLLSVAWVASRLLRTRSAALRHLLWIGAFSGLLALPLLVLWMPALRAPVTRFIPAAVLIRTDAMSMDSVKPASVTVVPPKVGAEASTLVSWRIVLLLLWACGATLTLARTAAGSVMILRLRHQSRPLEGTDLELIRQKQTLPDGIELLASGSNTMPIAMGFWRPAILLPAAAIAWTEEKRRAVILHEAAHLLRGDIATGLIARLALSLYWWNPLAWTAWREMVKERERAADDFVLRAGTKASEYASHLLEIAQTLSVAPLLNRATVAMVRRSELEDRLSAILDSTRRRTAPMRWAPALAIAIAVVVVAPLAAVRGQATNRPVQTGNIDSSIAQAQAEKNFEKLDGAAESAMAQRNWDEARRLLTAALQIRGAVYGQQSIAYGAGLSRLGNLERRLGQKDAVTFYTQAEALLGNHPEASSALTYLGIASIGSKKYDEAIAYLERAESVESSSQLLAQITIWKAIARDHQGRIDEADQLFRKAIGQQLGFPIITVAVTDQALYAAFLKRQQRDGEATALLAEIDAEQQQLSAQQTTPPSDGVYKIGGEVLPPKLVSKTEPGYTEEARIAKYQGTLTMSVEIGTDGIAHNARVLRGLGLGLDDQALDAVSRWRFAPASKDGASVPVTATIEVNFRLL